jgi:predicted CoA-substrate-specific enzyme activase
MITLGIDIGSISTKAVVLQDKEIVFSSIRPTGYDVKLAGEGIIKDLAVEGFDVSLCNRIVATGYGRNAVSFADKRVTEITCHATGVHFLAPEVRSIIDIGGQDCKAIAIDASGRVTDFAMNDKCAAGTGRFLEVMAGALEVDLEDFGDFSLQSGNPAPISSICTVFAESEVIAQISKGEQRRNIIAGIHNSVGSRVAALANRVGMSNPTMLTGGVAKNVGVVHALSEKLEISIKVSENAQINGALGAALIAAL